VTVAANTPEDTQFEAVNARTSTWPDVTVR
jgi:hypothetical protein